MDMTGQMPSDTPAVERHGHVCTVTPTCLPLGANQAAWGLLMRSGWAGQGSRGGEGVLHGSAAHCAGGWDPIGMHLLLTPANPSVQLPIQK